MDSGSASGDGPTARRPRRRALKTAGWLLANAAGLLAVAMLFEAGTRLLGVRFPSLPRPGDSDRGLWVYDATKGWFHAPGARGRSDLGGPDRGLVRINSLGLRGPDFAVAKASGVRRVLVFGDSFVFGIGVDEDHLLTAELGRMLSRSAASRYEVVNMGVSGYSTDQEFLLLEQLGLRIAPDLVLLVGCDNDFDGNLQDFVYHAYYKPYFELGPDGALELRNVPVQRLDRIQRLKLWLGQESNAWNAIRSRRASLPSLQAAIHWLEVGVPRRAQSDPVALMAELVLAFRRRVEAAGARFVFLNTGHRGERTTLFHALRARLQPHGVALLGLEGELGRARQDAPQRLWEFPADTHWNVDAHRRVAVVVRAFLASHGLLEAPPAAGGGRPPAPAAVAVARRWRATGGSGPALPGPALRPPRPAAAG